MIPRTQTRDRTNTSAHQTGRQSARYRRLSSILMVGFAIGLALGLTIPLVEAQTPIQAHTQAQDRTTETLRDPTQPPAAYLRAHSAASGVAGHAEPMLPVFKPQHLMIRDGVRSIMWNGLAYRVGDQLDGARIERISETEIWLKDSLGRRKLPLYEGIEKRPAQPSKKNTSGETSVLGAGGSILKRDLKETQPDSKKERAK